MEMKDKNNRYYKILITAFLICIVIILCLFALNGRYYMCSDGYIMDKWEREILYPGDKPEKF